MTEELMKERSEKVFSMKYRKILRMLQTNLSHKEKKKADLLAQKIMKLTKSEECADVLFFALAIALLETSEGIENMLEFE